MHYLVNAANPDKICPKNNSDLSDANFIFEVDHDT